MLRKRKDNINNKLNRLLDSYLNEIISKENFIDKKKELETESKEVSELIDELEKKTETKNTIIEKLDTLKKILK